MSQKLTLARYLEGRGSLKSLTRIEAEAFSVPYPLISGWPARYGAVEITDAMLEDLATRVASARRSTANKARRGLEGLAMAALGATAGTLPEQSSHLAVSFSQRPSAVRAVHGFAVRRAKRYRPRALALQA